MRRAPKNMRYPVSQINSVEPPQAPRRVTWCSGWTKAAVSLDDCGDHPLVRAYLDAVERQRGLRRGSNAKGKLVTRRAATGDCTHLERGPGHRRRTSSGAAALGFCSHGGSYQRL